MAEQFDAIVIGSGFGGAVAACRLAEAGARVLVLERGRRWEPGTYPSATNEDWFWDQYRPHRRNGWFDVRVFPRMAVVQGAGVGGGSLVYANISIEATPDVFKRGWPAEIRYPDLQRHYQRVGQMLGVSRLPQTQWSERTKLMHDAARAAGLGGRFRELELAVTFGEHWHYGLDDPHNATHSTAVTNEFGRSQGTCIHLGNCVLGCDVRAKNTLDLNYLARAETCQAEIRPLHLVRVIEPQGGGYTVTYDRIENAALHRGSASAKLVIVAAGSLGSTELLLRSRDVYRTLPDISRRLGSRWSSNGDFVTPATYDSRDISPTRGPTISAAIDLRDGEVEGQRMLIEDGGFPDLVGNWLEEFAKSRPVRSLPRAFKRSLRHAVRQRDPFRNFMPWFAQSVDAGDGQLRLRRRWRFFGSRRLSLDWNYRTSRAAIDAVIRTHKMLSEATGGDPMPPVWWTWLKFLITPHPLGGCGIGSAADDGVVDHRGEVFGYHGLYVADGAIVPTPIGANPSRTIAALAERLAEILVEERGLRT